MKNIIILIVFLFIGNLNYAQEIVSTSGETQTASGYEISWTIGEASIYTISAGSTVITQGFHQSKITITAIDEFLISDFKLKVYPNPTSEFITIEFYKNQKSGYFTLCDLNGKKLENRKLSTAETKVKFNNYTSGTYILTILDDFKVPLQTFRIIKQ